MTRGVAVAAAFVAAMVWRDRLVFDLFGIMLGARWLIKSVKEFINDTDLRY